MFRAPYGTPGIEPECVSLFNNVLWGLHGGIQGLLLALYPRTPVGLETIWGARAGCTHAGQLPYLLDCLCGPCFFPFSLYFKKFLRHLDLLSYSYLSFRRRMFQHPPHHQWAFTHVSSFLPTPNKARFSEMNIP